MLISGASAVSSASSYTTCILTFDFAIVSFIYYWKFAEDHSMNTKTSVTAVYPGSISIQF